MSGMSQYLFTIHTGKVRDRTLFSGVIVRGIEIFSSVQRIQMAINI